MDGTGRVYFTMADYVKFINGFMPDVRGAEYNVGPMHIDGDDLYAEYAYSSECSPADWKDKPLAVTEWKDEKEAT